MEVDSDRGGVEEDLLDPVERLGGVGKAQGRADVAEPEGQGEIRAFEGRVDRRKCVPSDLPELRVRDVPDLDSVPPHLLDELLDAREVGS